MGRKDPTLRHFVYYLLDGSGDVVYVGRSRNVAGRIEKHHYHATRDYEPSVNDKGSWIFDIRSVTMAGPMAWEAAVETERAEIERLQPRGNVKLTKRDPWPKANRERVSA